MKKYFKNLSLILFIQDHKLDLINKVNYSLNI